MQSNRQREKVIRVIFKGSQEFISPEVIEIYTSIQRDSKVYCSVTEALVCQELKSKHQRSSDSSDLTLQPIRAKQWLKIIPRHDGAQ